MPDKHTQDVTIDPYLEGLQENELHELKRRIEDELREAKQEPYGGNNVTDVIDVNKGSADGGQLAAQGLSRTFPTQSMNAGGTKSSPGRCRT
jgi:hypothetical protein